MKTHTIAFLAFAVSLLTGLSSNAQSRLEPLFSVFNFEVRGDFEYNKFSGANEDEYGFAGRYFNLRLGGDLGSGFSYFLRQRIIANPGTSTLFDNTDFLYLDYQPSPRWRLRAGKDALFMGGYEYDASPIDVYFESFLWDAIYCFQPAASVTHFFDDGKQSLSFQVGNSISVFSDVLGGNFGDEWRKGLLSYNLLWTGNFGVFSTLYSVNFFERERGYFMNTIALGNKLTFDRWSLYVDLIHLSLGTDDWGKSYCLVARGDVRPFSWLNLFAKGGYETNHSDLEMPYATYSATGAMCNLLERPETDSYFCGLGVEVVPNICRDVRLHAFVAQHHDKTPSSSLRNVTANVGVTWYVDVHRLAKQRGWIKE